MFKRNHPSSSKDSLEVMSEPRFSFIGGVKGLFWSMPPPFAKLDIFDDRIELGPSSRWIPSFLVPGFQGEFREFSNIQGVGSASWIIAGVRFEMVTGGSTRTFSTTDGEAILSALNSLGCRVNPERLRLGIFFS